MINQTAASINAQLNANPGAQSLLARSLSWMNEHYDEQTGLLCAPGSSGREHLIRESIWYALGLVVARISESYATHEGSQRIADIVRAVLNAQWNMPGTAWHGTFRRSPTEPDPPADAKIWRDYDPNWRQFIGTVLVLLLRLEGDGLLADDAAAIRQALKLCVLGEPEDRVPAFYTNIALMKAWLEVEAATETDAGNRQRGLAFARQIAKGFNQHGSFAEYNSPTYYGINFYALGLWQHYSSEPELQQLGRDISAKLWRDIAHFYHPVMKNLCGPFSRAYGMDMQQYVAALGLWIWCLAGEEDAPFPKAGLDTGTMGHAHDFALGPLAAITASAPVAEVMKRFRKLPAVTAQDESCFSRIITAAAERRAHAWITPGIMVGLETAEISFRGNPQYHPFTVHWLEGDQVRWLRLRFSGRLLGELQPGSAELTLVPDADVQDGLLQSSHQIRLQDGHWRCGSLKLKLDTLLSCTEVANGIRMSGLEDEAGVTITFMLNGAGV